MGDRLVHSVSVDRRSHLAVGRVTGRLALSDARELEAGLEELDRILEAVE
jgi:hypothetical protein